jgi:DNA-binding MarR family transcriptional regulator
MVKQATPFKRSLSYLTWIRMTRVLQLLRRRAEAESRHTGLSMAQLSILFELLAVDGRSQQELADEMQLTKGGITQHLDTLEALKLVRREREGRVNRVFLTDIGRTNAEKHFSAQQTFTEAAMDALSTEEQAQMITLLRKLDRHLR